MRAASDTQRTAGARLGGPRPGRTAVGADRAGGGGGHVVPARYRPGGARRAQVELYSWVRRRGWRRCLRHRPDHGALGTGNADKRSGGLWVSEPSFCRLGRWRSCRARPPSARSCRPARPCPVGHAQGGCVATAASGGSAPGPPARYRPLVAPQRQSPAWQPHAEPGGRGGDDAPPHAACGAGDGASAATPSRLAWVPASQPSHGGPAGRAGAGSSRPESPGPTLARLPRRQRPRRDG
jgi:hypothetical protein